MGRVSFAVGKSNSDVPVSGGRFVVLTDVKRLFYDDGSSRIQLSDVLAVDTVEGVVPVTGKLYLEKSTGRFYFADGSINAISLVDAIATTQYVDEIVGNISDALDEIISGGELESELASADELIDDILNESEA